MKPLLVLTGNTRRTVFSQFDPRLPQVPNLTRVIVQASSEAPNLLTPAQQIVAILVGIFTTFLSIVNTFFAWQVYRRLKAQEILMQLQIAKLRAELAEQEAKARKEAETGIILVS